MSAGDDHDGRPVPRLIAGLDDPTAEDIAALTPNEVRRRLAELGIDPTAAVTRVRRLAGDDADPATVPPGPTARLLARLDTAEAEGEDLSAEAIERLPQATVKRHLRDLSIDPAPAVARARALAQGVHALPARRPARRAAWVGGGSLAVAAAASLLLFVSVQRDWFQPMPVEYTVQPSPVVAETRTREAIGAQRMETPQAAAPAAGSSATPTLDIESLLAAPLPETAGAAQADAEEEAQAALALPYRDPEGVTDDERATREAQAARAISNALGGRRVQVMLGPARWQAERPPTRQAPEPELATPAAPMAQPRATARRDDNLRLRAVVVIGPPAGPDVEPIVLAVRMALPGAGSGRPDQSDVERAVAAAVRDALSPLLGPAPLRVERIGGGRP